jgi:hypothetical protein
VLGAEVLHLWLREVGVDLDLVDHRHYRCAVEQPAEVVDHEVADPDGPDLAVSEQRLQRPVGSRGLFELRRESRVRDQQVDLIDAELARAFRETMQCLVVSVVADPDLGLDKTSGRSRPGFRIASPTCRSLPYAAAVSTCW